MCLDTDSNDPQANQFPALWPCTEGNVNQQWDYEGETYQIKSRQYVSRHTLAHGAGACTGMRACTCTCTCGCAWACEWARA